MTDVFIICQLKEERVCLKSSRYRITLYVSFTSAVVKPPRRRGNLVWPLILRDHCMLQWVIFRANTMR